MAARKSPRRRAHPPLPEEALEDVAARFRALGAPSRLRILSALMAGPRDMAWLARQTGLEPSNLSRHVAELVRAGCVARIRQGRTVRVEIADPSLEPLCELVCGALARRAEGMRARLRGGPRG